MEVLGGGACRNSFLGPSLETLTQQGTQGRESAGEAEAAALKTVRGTTFTRHVPQVFPH